MAKVVHITAHMGGGIGKVLSEVACCAKQTANSFVHEIIMLEPPKNDQFVKRCSLWDVPVSLIDNDICKKMEQADIVQLEWWHHPLMAKFMHEFPRIPIRLVIWSHISGCSYPSLPVEFVKLPHRFLFTSRYSFENPLWGEFDWGDLKKDVDVVESSGGFADITGNSLVQHTGFHIGYIGTLDFVKMHPDYVDYCASVDIPEVKFILVGEAHNRQLMEKQAQEKKMDEKFEWSGYTNDIAGQLARMDVFGYLLNPQHYGTAENALLEAMAAGVPAIVLNQCAEKYIVEHMKTGIVINDKQEYAAAIRYLYENPSERVRIGRNAQNFVRQKFSVEKTVSKLNENYQFIIKQPKKVYFFDSIFGQQPHQWFLKCLSEGKKYYLNSMDEHIRLDVKQLDEIEQNIAKAGYILRGENKASVYQFSRYCHEDKWLSYWCDILNKKA